MQLSWTLNGHYPLSQSTKQPLWRYVCHELNESPKCHNFFTYAILSLSQIQSSLSGGTCVTNFELHTSPKCHRVFTYTILDLRYGAALVMVCVSRTERVTEMSQSLYIHKPLSQCTRQPLWRYGVATVSRIDKIIGLFCRILSLL